MKENEVKREERRRQTGKEASAGGKSDDELSSKVLFCMKKSKKNRSSGCSGQGQWDRNIGVTIRIGRRRQKKVTKERIKGLFYMMYGTEELWHTRDFQK